MSILAQYNASCDECGVKCKLSGDSPKGAVMAARVLKWRASKSSHVCKTCLDKKPPAKKEVES